MANSSLPLQQGRTTIVTSDGHIVDRQLVHVTSELAGNVSDMMGAMPALGSPNSEPDLPAPLYSKGVVSMIDGKQSIGQLTYDNKGGGGFWVGAVRKGSRTLPSTQEDFNTLRYFNTTDGIQLDRSELRKRTMRVRIETRLVRDANGIDGIVEAIDTQLGYGWFKPSGNYIFVDGVIYESGAQVNEYRVEYAFLLRAGVPANPLGAGSVNIPELLSNTEYKKNYNLTTGVVTSVEAIPMWREDVDLLRLPGL